MTDLSKLTCKQLNERCIKLGVKPPTQLLKRKLVDFIQNLEYVVANNLPTSFDNQKVGESLKYTGVYMKLAETPEETNLPKTWIEHLHRSFKWRWVGYCSYF